MNIFSKIYSLFQENQRLFFTTTRLQEEYQRVLDGRDAESQTTSGRPTSSEDPETEGDSDNDDQATEPSLSFQSARSRSSAFSDTQPHVPPSRNRSNLPPIPETPLIRPSGVRQEPTPPPTGGRPSFPHDPAFQQWLRSRSPWQATPRPQPEQVDPWVKRRMSEERGRRREDRLAAMTLHRQVGMALGLFKGVQITVQTQPLNQPVAPSSEPALSRKVDREPNSDHDLYEDMSGRKEEDRDTDSHQAEEVDGAASLRDPTLSQSVYVSPSTSQPSLVATPAPVSSLQPLDASTPLGHTSYSSPVRKRRAFKASLHF